MSCLCSNEEPQIPLKRVHVLVQASVQTLLQVLSRCRKEKRRVSTLRLHEYMQKCGLEAHHFVRNYVVPMLVESGCLLDAHQVLNRSAFHNERSWSALIAGYLKHEKPQHSLTLYQKMQANETLHPSSFTIVAVLKACVMLREYGKGVDVHSEIARMGLLGDNLFISSCLVDMYAKLGLPSMAQEVFDELPHRDVFVWSALIRCFIEFESAGKALECFNRMQLESVSPDVSAFASTLKACGSVGDLKKGQGMHAIVAGVEYVEGEVFVGSTLVDMYAKCGSLALALKAFDRLPSRNVVVWTALISGYAEKGSSEQAVRFFEQMQLEGVHPDDVTIVCVLKSCGIISCEQKCVEIHGEIERLGLLDKSSGVSNALVDMYAKTGDLSKAREVFENLPLKDMVSWNALTAGYASHGYMDEAAKCLERMELEGISPNVATYISLSSAYSAVGDMDNAKQMLFEIQRDVLPELDAIVGSSLVSAYVKCGLLREARQVFDKLPARNLVAWNALIAGYVENGRSKEALDCLYRMQVEGVFPDAITFVSCLKACGAIGALDMVEALHTQIKRLGLLDTKHVANTLVLVYARCGSLRKAQAVFDSLSDRNVVAWTALIAGHAEHGHGEEALALLECMLWDGVSPDLFSLVYGLKACGDVGAIDKGEELYAEIERQGLLEESLVVGNSLLDMYAKCGLLTKAQEVFDNLFLRDIVTWNTLIAAYAESACGEEAVKCYEQMRLQGIAPDAITLVCTLKACGSIGARCKGYEIQGEIERQGLVERDHFVGSTLVDIYAKWGLLEIAQQVFDVLPFRDVVSWNALMTAYAQSGRSKNVFWFFDRMVGEGIKPDPVTFIVILSACRRTGHLMKGQMYFETMSKDYGIIPLYEHHNCMVNVLGHAGHLDKAVSVIKKMPNFTNLKVWITFLSACRDWGSMAVAKEAFQGAVDLDEKNPVAYVMLSHLYAGAAEGK